MNRYVNYFERIKSNPVLKYQKFFLNRIVINGAPAIAHPTDPKGQSIYISIDSKSYYKPVLRVFSHGSIVYSSFNKNSDVESINYSIFNSAKFEVNEYIFADTMIELLHYQDNKFKQLFLIQFNTLFADMTSLSRFNKEEIDGVCKDIRYPNEFYLDVFYDELKSQEISVYEEYIASWKSSLSKFILNTISTKKEKAEEVFDEKSTKKKMEIKKEQEKEKDRLNNNISPSNENKNLKDFNESNNRENNVEMVNKSSETNKNNSEKLNKENVNDNDNDDEEDLDQYLKSLENRA